MKCSLAILTLLCMLVTAGQAAAAWPPENCTHVEVLGSGDTDKVSWRFDGGLFSGDARLDEPGRHQLATLGDALDLLPEFLCQSVQSVAFVHNPPDNDGGPVTTGWTTRNDRQNTVYLNTHSLSPWNNASLGASKAAREQAMQRFIHEATHTAVRLLQSQQKAEPLRTLQERADENLWPADAQARAEKIIESNRLHTGVLREWQRVHDQFVIAGMAEAYYGSNWTAKEGSSADALSSAGFMSAYGGEQAIEDIAETASWAILRGVIADTNDSACQMMNSRSGPSISSGDAAVFTKVGFVRTLEFITEQQYRNCVGSLEIEAPGQGFHSYKKGKLNRSYTGNPRAGVGRGRGVDEQWLLANITADGPLTTSSGSFPATVSLQLNVTPAVDGITESGERSNRMAVQPSEVSYPRGIYFVGSRHNKHNRLHITRQQDGALIVDVAQGIALIGRASSEGIKGSIAVQRIFNFSGGLLSSIAGDEPVSEASKITFRYVPRNQ